MLWTNHISIYVFYLQCAASIPFIFVASRRWTADRIIGDLSYPLYIVHIPAIWIVEATPWLGGKENGGPAALGLSLGFAGLLYLLVDRPVEYWRSRDQVPVDLCFCHFIRGRLHKSLHNRRR